MSMGRRMAFAAALMWTSTPAVAMDLKSETRGSWTLVSYVSTSSDGAKTENFGPDPIGTAFFDELGNFSISIVRSGLPKFASNNREKGTAEENAAVVRGSIAYFGTYTVSDSDVSLVFRIAGATLPNWIGTTQKRTVRLNPSGELILVNAAASGGGVAEITWRRAQ